jgi:hypothetical protein
VGAAQQKDDQDEAATSTKALHTKMSHFRRSAPILRKSPAPILHKSIGGAATFHAAAATSTMPVGPQQLPRALPSGAGRRGATTAVRCALILRTAGQRPNSGSIGGRQPASGRLPLAVAPAVLASDQADIGALWQPQEWQPQPQAATASGSLNGGCARDGPALASPLAEGNGVPIAVSGIWQSQDNTTCESYDDSIERRKIGLRAVHHV